MIQPDADTGSPNEVSASALATDDEKLSSLPTDEVGELIERLGEWATALEGSGEIASRRPGREGATPRAQGLASRAADLRQAASALSRLRGERDELSRFNADLSGANVEMMDELEISEAARLKAEDLNRKLVEGLSALLGLLDDKRHGVVLETMGPSVPLAELLDTAEAAPILEAARSLLSSISGGEAAGEDGP